MTDRLSLAVARGIVALPEGEVLVLGAVADSDLGALDKARTRLLWRYHDAHLALAARGWTSVRKPGGPADGVVVFAPRAREAQRAYLRLAREMTDGPIIVDGPKSHGIDALYREIRQRADVSEAWSKAHGKVFVVNGGDFSDWPEIHPAKGADGWWRAPGVFSADGIDKASAFLATELPLKLEGAVLDLGAGWGYLSRAILERDGVTALTLVENDETALRAAYRNVEDDRAAFVCADVRTWRPDQPVDHVVTNPPFHAGRASDPELGRAFILAAADMLKPKGQLWLVANRHLPYESTLEDAFRNVQTLTPNPSFKLFHATSPKPRRKG
ncbi:MAG: class I SAM-dependent methyltransferase [Silicimonas sp.]|nr:class I SAM-dependent methyltransferase [Silicimonas sp.]